MEDVGIYMNSTRKEGLKLVIEDAQNHAEYYNVPGKLASPELDVVLLKLKEAMEWAEKIRV